MVGRNIFYSVAVFKIVMKLLTVILAYWLVYFSYGEIVFKDNGYEDILIVIEDGTPENPDLITKIEKMFEYGSSYLHNATGRLTYFRSASVVIPKNWNLTNKFPVTNVYSEFSYSSADIRVGKANPFYENTPYTLQPGGCFEPGQYIHFTPEYLLDKNGEISELFGHSGRQLVHEWAHFRYGVFDEYGIPGDTRFPPFYIKGEDFVPTSCSENVEGYLVEADGTDGCYVDRDTGLPVDCNFHPSIYDNKIQSSIMYLPNLPTVTDFCDDSDSRRHNFDALSQQNVLCNYLPTWHVVKSHPDLQNIQSDKGVNLTQFKLSVIQPIKEAADRYVIVGDISGSMQDNYCLKSKNLDRIDCINIAFKRFVEYYIPDGSSLGVVQFNSNSEVISPMVTINNSTRKKLSNMEFPRSNSGTNIKAGLEAGIKLLQTNGKSSDGGVIILLSDGEDSVEDRLINYLRHISDYKVIINTIAIGLGAPEYLTRFVKQTGGRTFFLSPDDKDLSKLDEAFKNSLINKKDNSMIEIAIKSLKIQSHSTTTTEMFIDSNLGRKTQFKFSSPTDDLDSLNIKLISPSGKNYTQKNKDLELIETSRLKIFSFSNAQPGKWIVEMKSISQMQVSIALSSKTKDIHTTPIRSKCWLSDVKVDLSVISFVKVFCQVSKDYNAVIRANVKANIKDPHGNDYNYQLSDDGSGADNIADDGIYSAYFFDFTSDNRYTVSVTVNNKKGTRVVVGTKSTSAPMIRKTSKSGKMKSKFPMSEFLISPNKKKTSTNKGISSGEFQRFVTVDSFYVQNSYNFDERSLRPAKVTDLRVIKSKKSKYNVANVELKWTSSGNNFDVGKAKEVLIYYAQSSIILVNNTKEAVLLNSTHVTDGNLNNLSMPHQPQTLKLTIKNVETSDLFFALKTVSFNNVQSNFSNIAATSFIEIKVGHYGEKDEEPKSNNAVAIGVSCGVILVIIIGVIAFFVIRRKK